MINTIQTIFKKRVVSYFMFFMLGVMTQRRIFILKKRMLKRRNLQHQIIQKEAEQEVSNILNMIDTDSEEDEDIVN